MSQTRAQILSPVGILTASGLNVSGVITATSFSGSGANLTGVGGLGTNVTDVSGFTYIESAKIVSSNIVFDNTNSGTSNSYILLKEKQLTIETGFGVTIGTGKQLIINVLDLP